MIKPDCCKCKKELDDFGGILLSPPYKKKNRKNKKKKRRKEIVDKDHLCKECYQQLLCWLFNYKYDNK